MLGRLSIWFALLLIVLSICVTSVPSKNYKEGGPWAIGMSICALILVIIMFRQMSVVTKYIAVSLGTLSIAIIVYWVLSLIPQLF